MLTLTLKAVVVATLLVNSAWAEVNECKQSDGRCPSKSVLAGQDKLVGVRCTINVAGALDLGNCKVIETATGRFIYNDNFRGDTGTKWVKTPTTGAYYCRVEKVGADRGTVYCRIQG